MPDQKAVIPGTALLREFDSDLVGALADAALDCSLLISREGTVRWASTGFARRAKAPIGTLIGAPLQDAIEALGRLRNSVAPQDLGPDMDGEILTFERSDGLPPAYRVVVRPIGDTEEAGLSLVALVDVSVLVDQLHRAEHARAAIEQRLNADAETGLPNERKLIDVLSAHLSCQSVEPLPVGLLLVDVLEFAQIVDLYGVENGKVVIEELVLALSKGLQRITNDAPFISRTKESEVAIVMPRVKSTTSLVACAEALVQDLSITVATGLGDCRVNGVVSLAQMRPGEGAADQLLKNARIAMNFRDLPRRAGQIRIYEPEMRAALEARSRTYSDLHAALVRDEIVPFFQPQVRLSDRSVVGFEVLVRWRHPEQGVVPPGLFLEIAEETGLLPQIDEVVMRKAIDCLATWHRTGHGGPRISLNCTGASLRDPGYVDRLVKMLDDHGLSPWHVGIEILESVFFGDERDSARHTLYALQEQGFYLEIDDFGTGQASISHLITLPANAVKLDRSLVRDIETNPASRLVVEATLALSRNLGLSTLAEGTETESQISLLHELGCDCVQGFGIARPMPFDETTAWLERWRGQPPGETGEAPMSLRSA